MVETRHRWFGHVDRRLIDYVVRLVGKMKDSQTQITRGIGRSRKTIKKTIKNDLESKRNTKVSWEQGYQRWPHYDKRMTEPPTDFLRQVN